MKLFRKDVDRTCKYCIHAGKIMDDSVLCFKKEKYCSPESKCMHYNYDPLKRTPAKAKALDFSKYEEYDYSL